MSEAPLQPTSIMAHRRTLVLEAIRRHFRDYGASPTLAEIGARVNLPASRIGRFLHELAGAGEISWTPGAVRSIRLGDALAMVADSAIEIESRRRRLGAG